MPVTIEELDATVRAFYEGRGDQVGNCPALAAAAALPIPFDTDLSVSQ